MAWRTPGRRSRAAGQTSAREKRGAAAGRAGFAPAEAWRLARRTARPNRASSRHDTETEGVAPIAGAEPDARAGTQVLRIVEPRAAAQHAAATVALPAVLCPLPQIADPIGQTHAVGAVGADRAGAEVACPFNVSIRAENPRPPAPTPSRSATDTPPPPSGSATTRTPARRPSSRTSPGADPSARSRDPATNHQ